MMKYKISFFQKSERKALHNKSQNLTADYTDHRYESSAHDPENLKDMKWRIMKW
jgi:hypothetical protein